MIGEVYKFAKIASSIMKEVKCFMKNLNIDFVKVLGYVGAGLSVAATVVSGIAQKKSMNETIAKEVAEAMKNHQ
mgnify:CR=1 FL=1